MAIARTKEMDLRSDDYNFISPIAGGALVAGEVLEVEGTAGFTLVDVISGAQYTLVQEASQVKCMKAAVAINAGEAIYWLDASDVVTNVATLDIIGYAIETVAIGDATVLVDLKMTGKNIIT